MSWIFRFAIVKHEAELVDVVAVEAIGTRQIPVLRLKLAHRVAPPAIFKSSILVCPEFEKRDLLLPIILRDLNIACKFLSLLERE